MVVWIQLPAFPVHFYHKEILFMIGNMIGRSIKLDFHMQHQQRAKFARMAVELGLSKPLVTRLRLDGKWQYIEYENLPAVCFECGKIGHTNSSCPSLAANTPAVTTRTLTMVPEGWSETLPEDKAGFGPWMQVTRRPRRGSRTSEKGNSGAMQGDLPNLGKTGKGKISSRNMEVSNGQKEAPSQREETVRGGTQEKGKTAWTGKRNGKEEVSRVGMEVTTGGKGVLGPIPLSSAAGPTQGSNKANVNSRNKDMGSSSTFSGPKARLGPAKHLPGKGLAPPSPPPMQEFAGPNATLIQVVSVPSIDSQKEADRKAETPSTAARTKKRNEEKKKNSKTRKSPKKISAKTLQVWTPVKENKTKSRARMATLTLQEIDAWTGAAKLGQSEKALGNDAEEPSPFEACASAIPESAP
ncbi:unnamed protein product [Linum tenue]|uniref:CCHC-type domain-containing protein n=1 Tax=Linum tenue TaxID=586396 RepID=A0AAV0LCR5_9ROSI|nr:unnamed protein product [Linum tenue]